VRGEERGDLLLDRVQAGGRVGTVPGEEVGRGALQETSGAFEGLEGVLDRGRVRVGEDRLDLGTLACHPRGEGREVVLLANRSEGR